MPKCKNCGSRLSRFDKDICPLCGVKNPLEGVTSDTVEITSDLKLNIDEINSFRPKTKFTTMMLFFFVGWTGIPMFYLRYFLQGLVYFIINAILLLGGYAICHHLLSLDLVVSIIISVGFIYLINIILGIYVFYKHNLKDGSGEFLR